MDPRSLNSALSRPIKLILRLGQGRAPRTSLGSIGAITTLPDHLLNVCVWEKNMCM